MVSAYSAAISSSTAAYTLLVLPTCTMRFTLVKNAGQCGLSSACNSDVSAQLYPPLRGGAAASHTLKNAAQMATNVSARRPDRTCSPPRHSAAPPPAARSERCSRRQGQMEGSMFEMPPARHVHAQALRPRVTSTAESTCARC